jgi:hypothetical protein
VDAVEAARAWARRFTLADIAEQLGDLLERCARRTAAGITA